MVSFHGSERHMGEAAASIAAHTHRNTVFSLYRLLGVPRADQIAEVESKRVTCPLVADPAMGLTAAQASHSSLDSDNDQNVFSMQATVPLLFTNLKATASNEYKAPVRNLVISVPAQYTKRQRRAMIDAAAIANIKYQ